MDAVPPVQPTDVGNDLFYTPGESVFGAVARQMVANGWSVFPQEIYDDRKPGTVQGKMIKWLTDHDLSNSLPKPEDLERWIQYCPGLNVACALGAGSGNIFFVDIDVTDAARSEAIQDLADDILGYTPLRRVGRAPKIALGYRFDPNDPVDNVSPKFAAEDGSQNGDGIEILTTGKPITLHGRHHKTGQYFKWLDKNPLAVGPSVAPVVSSDLIVKFLDAVNSAFPFARATGMAASLGESWDWDEESRANVPRVRLAAGSSAWRENAEGKVEDGREQYLSAVVFRVVMADPARLTEATAAGGDALKAFIEEATKQVVQTFQETAVIKRGDRWDGRNLKNEAFTRVRHLVAKAQKGVITPRARPKSAFKDGKDGKAGALNMASQDYPQVFAPPRFDNGCPDLTFLPEPPSANRPVSVRQPFRGRVNTPSPLEPVIIENDRTNVARQVQVGLDQAFDTFFNDVYENRDPSQPYAIHILKAPTGAGKTSRMIRRLAADPRTYQDLPVMDDAGNVNMARCPFVMLLPTYENIEELRSRAQVLNLDGSLSDADLRIQATEAGLMHADDVDAKLAELRRDALNAGLRTMVYRGKLAAGCQEKDKVSAAMAANIGTAAFCKSKVVQPDGTSEEVFCRFYHGCPAIGQRADIESAHIVFMPHAFLSLAIPEELQQVRAVIADERVHHLFIHSKDFGAATLEIPRKRPRLTKQEVDSGLTPEDCLAERNEAGDIALDALRRGLCPAMALFMVDDGQVNAERHRGVLMVKSALRVCSSAIQRDALLNPDMTLEEVQELCAQPTGHEVKEEYRFWKIIEDRMQRLFQDGLRNEALTEIDSELDHFVGEHDLDRRLRLEKRRAAVLSRSIMAHGERDMRIQLLIDQLANGHKVERIRISWRTEPNWIEKPMLLLDASAAPKIISKIWNSRPVVTHNVDAALNMRVVGIVDRTYSNVSLVGHPGMTERERTSAGRLMHSVRRAISTVSALYGFGRVVLGTSICLRKAVNTGWVCPDNTDWCHFGAMRGLDFAKYHAAALSIGRMEVPSRTIDGLVAALTFDDPEPEQPFDLYGNGLDQDGNPLRLPMGVQNLRMRSGHVVELPVPMYPGEWARLIQRQYREEEALQFGGRLRPVYREGRSPPWFILSTVIPEDLIVDDLISLPDMLPVETDLWEVARVTGGVISLRLARSACPDLFRTDRRAGRLMMKAGFNIETGEQTGRMTEGFVPVRWRDPVTKQEEWAFVRSGVNDHDARVVDAVQRFLQIDAELAEVHPARGQGMARIRRPDKVDDFIGDKEKRAELEQQVRENVALQLFDNDLQSRSPTNDAPTQFQAGKEYGLADLFLTYTEFDARESLREFWTRQSSVASDSLAGPVIADDRDTFDQMGENVEYEEVLLVSNAR